MSENKYRPCDCQSSSTAPFSPEDGACRMCSRAMSNAVRVRSVWPATARRVNCRHSSIAWLSWRTRDC